MSVTDMALFPELQHRPNYTGSVTCQYPVWDFATLISPVLRKWCHCGCGCRPLLGKAGADRDLRLLLALVRLRRATQVSIVGELDGESAQPWTSLKIKRMPWSGTDLVAQWLTLHTPDTGGLCFRPQVWELDPTGTTLQTTANGHTHRNWRSRMPHRRPKTPHAS